MSFVQEKPRAITEENAKEAAVLLPLIIKDLSREAQIREGLKQGAFNPADFELLFEVRSTKLDTQPGDICFPGGLIGIKGAALKEDAVVSNKISESPQDAAVRECCEELLVSSDQIEVLGALDYFHRNNLVIFPFLAILSGYEGGFNKDEVSEIFTVPLDFFVNNQPEGHNMEWHQAIPEDFPVEKIYGGRNYKFRKVTEIQYFWEYKDRIIWGITAKILNRFVQNLS